MDKDYLDNIAGSPHIDEGLGSQILSRGAAGAQRIAAMTGGSFSDINYTKIESLFNGFIKKITKILEDFSEGNNSIANRLEQMRPQITPEQQKLISELRELYELIVPPYLRQHQVKHSVLTPRSSRSNLSEMLKEGIFTREMSLNSALQTNDPTKILNAYISLLKKEFDTFLRDAMKVTGAPKDYVKRVVGNLNKKWSSILNKIEQISGTPLIIPTTTQGQSQSAAVNIPVSTQPQSQPTVSNSSEQTSKDDFASIIERVVDIIIETVKSDVERAEKFFSQNPKDPKELPTNWDQPAMTKEAIEDEDSTEDEPSPNDTEPSSTPTEDDADREKSSEFLYNFHARYDKQRNFAIDVEPPEKKLKYIKLKSGNGKTKELNVIWSNKQHENDIYVKYTTVQIQDNDEEGEIVKPLDTPGQVLIFKFWDDQVNPRKPEAKNFSVEKLLEQANPTAVQLFSKADSSLRARIEKKQETLLRALYATTYRKAMEFKRKLISLSYDEQGNLFRNKKNGTKEPITKEQLMAYLDSKDPKERERWKTSLEKINYFEKFPGILPKKSVTIDEIPSALDAVKALQALGHKAIPSMKAVQAAIDDLGNTASTEEYVKYALAKDKPVSNPVSNEPVKSVSSPVSAPVSKDIPEPEKAPQKPGERELGKASWNENGTVIWEKPDGKNIKLTPKQLKKMSIPRLELLLQQQGYFEKFPQASKSNVDEGIINPFDLSNFL